MSPETLTLDDAKRLLSLPRVVGEHPEGGEILAQNGRYGPYLTWEKETRSLEDEDQIFTVDLEARARAVRPAQGAGTSRRGEAAWPTSARTRSPSATSWCAAAASAST